MSLSAIPRAGLHLHGIAQPNLDFKSPSTPAILFNLTDDLLNEVKNSANAQGGLQLLTGNAPKIRLGKRTIDLSISPEEFRHELYSASTESLHDLDFAGVVSHRAELKLPERKQSIGTDAALAALQSSMASLKQEKEARSVNISSNVVAEPKNRWEAARQQNQARRRGLLNQSSASPSMGPTSTSYQTTTSTSAAMNDSAARMQAMKTPLIHLLAMKHLSKENMMEKTHIPKDDLDDILGRIGKQEQGKWQLTDRSYKELDVWKFKYTSQEDRQSAIDNAIRAYDRLRLGKEDRLWQLLLPKEDRDKGIVLSKLHFGNPGVGRNHASSITGSPLPFGEDGNDSAANTPRLGPSSTPKVGAGKSDGSALTKRLFAKDPKKQRAAEEAKDKKRKDRETAAAASDREGGKPPPKKRQTTKLNNPKVKSAEIVHSSSEDSEGGAKKAGSTKSAGSSSSSTSSQPKPLANERKPAVNAVRPRSKLTDTTASLTADASAKTARPKTVGGATPKVGTPKTGTSSTSASRPVSAAATKTSRPAALGKNTPNGLAAPASQHRTQLSPQKSGSRPTVPSPLGAARPRVASDVSDRGAVGVQRVRQGADTPKGLGITNGVRKRQDTVTSSESSASNRSDQVNGDHPKPVARKSVVNGNGTSKAPPVTNGTAHKGENGLKRKAVDSPAQSYETGPANKHRKTESSSSSSQKSSVGANSSTDLRLERSTSSDSVSSIINEMTFRQGVNQAQKFRDIYYPQYAKLYDEQAEMEQRGITVPSEDRRRLWEMHRRLEQMKREIRAASQREHLDE